MSVDGIADFAMTFILAMEIAVVFVLAIALGEPVVWGWRRLRRRWRGRRR
jgi:hypothetical protein